MNAEQQKQVEALRAEHRTGLKLVAKCKAGLFRVGFAAYLEDIGLLLSLLNAAEARVKALETALARYKEFERQIRQANAFDSDLGMFSDHVVAALNNVLKPEGSE